MGVETWEEPSVFSEVTRHISMNAISGINTYQAMKVLGEVKKNSLHILIDSGSTHNFLDVVTARRLSCDMKSTVPLQISVANGSKLVSSTICKDFSWYINGVEFQTDVMVVPLGSCEMILGVQ